jgi:cytoskeletal protein RodZ
MMNHTNSPASLGARLRAMREAKGVTLNDLAARTRVPPAKLLALEEDRWSDLPAPVYARGFIRAAAKALGVEPADAEALVAAFNRESPPSDLGAPTIHKSDLLVPILVKGDKEERGRAVLGVLLLALAGLAIPIVAFLMS